MDTEQTMGAFTEARKACFEMPALQNGRIILTAETKAQRIKVLTTELQLLICLKTVDTIGYFQRAVFSLGASKCMHKITNL